MVLNEDNNSLKVDVANKKYKQKQVHFFLMKNSKNVIPRRETDDAM